MKTTRVKSFGELRVKLRASLRKKERQLERARRRAAERHASYLMRNMPVAFGELRATVHAEGMRVVVDAPHAAAVERGSRPHWMPLEPLIKWVKLRGFQGLASTKAQARLPGSTTAGHATRMAGRLREHNDETGYSDWRASDVEGPVVVARAIQAAIAKRGTKPTWFMRDSVPKAQAFLREEISRALEKE